MGFGLGSASLVENVRFHNCTDMERYMKGCESGVSVKEDIQNLTIEEQMEEFMFLGLRMMQGISCLEFLDCFGKSVDEVYPGIVDKFVNMGLLVRTCRKEEEWIALTKQGIDVSNQIMAEFLLS